MIIFPEVKKNIPKLMVWFIGISVALLGISYYHDYLYNVWITILISSFFAFFGTGLVVIFLGEMIVATVGFIRKDEMEIRKSKPMALFVVVLSFCTAFFIAERIGVAYLGLPRIFG